MHIRIASTRGLAVLLFLSALLAVLEAGRVGAVETEAGASETSQEAPAKQSREEEENPDEVADAGSPQPGAQEPEISTRGTQEEEPTQIEAPLFPQVRYRDAIRLRLESHFVPSSGLGAADVTLYEPSARLRVTLPVSKKAVLQLTGRWQSSRYEFDGATDLFGLGPTQVDPVADFHALAITLQGAVQLDKLPSLFVEDERWSLLASGSAAWQWEDGNFSDGLIGRGALAFGYEIDRFRLAVGFTLGSRLDDGFTVGPIVTLRWFITDRLTFRNRGLGAQFDYRFSNKLDLFAAGYANEREYRMNDRVGVPGELTWRDRQWLVGAGFEWKLSRYLRLNAEGGAVPSRKISIRQHGDDLFAENTDPGGYFDIRIEVRP